MAAKIFLKTYSKVICKSLEVLIQCIVAKLFFPERDQFVEELHLRIFYKRCHQNLGRELY